MPSSGRCARVGTVRADSGASPSPRTRPRSRRRYPRPLPSRIRDRCADGTIPMTGVSETVAGRPDDVALDRDEGRASRFTPRDRTLLVVAGLLAFFALPLRGLLRYQGP